MFLSHSNSVFKAFLAVSFTFCLHYAQAQNSMGIGTNTPNQNAVLDLVSPTNDQGFLVPRVTTTQRSAMASGLNLSDNGLLVYDTDDGKFYYWINPSWFELSTVTVVPGSISDLEINAAAAIQGTKIDPDFGAQDIITTGNITGFAFLGDGSGLTGVPTTPGPSTVGSLELIDDDIFDVDVNAAANIAASKLESTVMEAGENVSLLANDAGYMTTTVYDPGTIAADAFDLTNHTGQVDDTQISDVDVSKITGAPNLDLDDTDDVTLTSAPAAGDVSGDFSTGLTVDQVGSETAANIGTATGTVIGAPNLDLDDTDDVTLTSAPAAGDVSGDFSTGLTVDQVGSETAANIGTATGTVIGAPNLDLDDTDDVVLTTNPAAGDVSGDFGTGLTVDQVGSETAANVATTVTDFNDVGIQPGGTITDNTDVLTALGELEGAVEGTSAIIGNNPPNQNLFAGTNAGGGLTTGTENTFIGESAGTAVTTESQNTFLGTLAGQISTNVNNTLIGYGAGQNNTGPNNTVVGHTAGTVNTGIANTFVGARAGQANTTGGNNAFIGFSAGISNLTGTSNAFLGYFAGFNSTSNNNVFIGESAGVNNAAGANNTMVGQDAGITNITGNNLVLIGQNADVGVDGLNNAIAIGQGATVNTSNSMVLGSSLVNVGIKNSSPGVTLDLGGTDAIQLTSGTNAQRPGAPVDGMLRFNTDQSAFEGYIGGWVDLIGSSLISNPGTNNIFAGAGAGLTNTGSDNTFVGYNSGNTNVVGNDNTFLGSGSGELNDGNFNTFIGSSAGIQNTTGGGNTFLGFGAGFLNSTAGNNTYIGCSSGLNNSGGTLNTFIGSFSGTNNSTGLQNAFMGQAAGNSNTTGSNNVFMGHDAGNLNLTGNSNIFIGTDAGRGTDASNNVFIGGAAGDNNTSGTDNIAIGASADMGATGLTNAIAIGSGAVVNQNNSMVLGGSVLVR